MPVTLIVGGVDAASVEVGLSPLAELVAYLHALTEREHHTRATAEDLSGPASGFHEEVRTWSPVWAAYRGRFLLPAAAPLGRHLAEELEAVARLPTARFAEVAGYAIRGGNSGPPLDRLLEDHRQRELLLHAASLRSTARSELAGRLFDSPEGFRSDLLDFLARFAAACFEEPWARVHPILTAEAYRMRQRMRDRGVAAALAAVDPTARLLDSPPRVVFDLLRSTVARLGDGKALVVPSWYGAPHVLVKHEPGWTVVVQYGVAAGGGPEVSLALLRARLSLLADPARIRLCRLIAREALTTTELAARSGMAKPQVSRYLRQLREAGLVSTERDGRLVLYRLDLTRIRHLSADLELALFR